MKTILRPMNPMMMKNEPSGPLGPGVEMEICGLKRLHRQVRIRTALSDEAKSEDSFVEEIRLEELNAWSARTAAGDPVHIHYQAGVLTIEVDLPSSRGCRRPVTVMRWQPLRAQATLSTPVVPFGKQPDARELSLHRERELLAAKSVERREMLSGDSGKFRRVSEHALRGWLRDHHRRYADYAVLGLAGSRLRFHLALPEPVLSSTACVA